MKADEGVRAGANPTPLSGLPEKYFILLYADLHFCASSCSCEILTNFDQLFGQDRWIEGCQDY